jgi:uncharacterized protein YneF (UPF0154 family)
VVAVVVAVVAAVVGIAIAIAIVDRAMPDNLKNNDVVTYEEGLSNTLNFRIRVYIQ